MSCKAYDALAYLSPSQDLSLNKLQDYTVSSDTPYSGQYEKLNPCKIKGSESYIVKHNNFWLEWNVDLKAYNIQTWKVPRFRLLFHKKIQCSIDQGKTTGV